MRRLTASSDGRHYHLAISSAPGSTHLVRIQITTGSGEDQTHEVQILSRTGGRWTLVVDDRIEDVIVANQPGGFLIVTWKNRTYRVGVSTRRRGADAWSLDEDAATSVRADMAGKVVTIFKRPGDFVDRGEPLAILEAMKMQNPVKALRRCRVTGVHIVEGQVVAAGQALFEVE